MTDIKAAIEMAKTSNGPSCDLLTDSVRDNSKLRTQNLEKKKFQETKRQP